MTRQIETQTTEGDLAGSLREIVRRLDRTLDNDLWDEEDIATYTRLAKKTVQNHYIRKAGFPRPVILDTGGKRWMRDEVKAWVLRERR